MDWKAIGEKVFEYAPTVGAAILNPAAGVALLGKKILSDTLGTDGSPESAMSAILADPNIAAKLKQIESEKAAEIRVAELSAEVETIKAVNETIRAETQLGHPWAGAWRPFWGFVSAIAFAVAVIGILVLIGIALFKNDAALLGVIPGIISQLAFLFGIPGAILGVASWHRGQEKRVKAGEQKGVIVGAIASAITAKIKK